MPLQYQYSFFRIPKDGDVASSVDKYKNLRLQALSIAPGSFSSTYEIESALPNTEWKARLTADQKETFACSATPLHNDDPRSAIWVAQLTLRGPLTKEQFSLPAETDQRIPEDDRMEERWQMLSLFTLPDHRGQRLGQKLCQEALSYLKSYRTTPSKVRVRLMVKPENHVTVKLYQKLGFREIGKCTLVEALIANGDADLLPEDRSEEKYTRRSGLIMVSEISRLE
ncbi:hypothetical protein BGW36DRAFT_369102 [Talaromyces proteolyticus]|uniref:N-acetyltransferase domain-containing protein n=1 Tax=Talaromyces proteolyticus TaxID=1131652 RepID=A0AAD4L0K3_9EURO|nr:uncharacterized protein BGW36DRAFT_369102 [Talaromyces proteolyticus]KAH8703290.1 hypothetical protein BGW36DRAFT_369102 [Talaromyces proteolyticus]